MQQIESPIKTLLALPASMAPSISIITRDKQNMFQLLRPAANDRTRMGWHKRHASVSDRGSRGILRPETLNLEAWISCSGIFQKNPKMNKRKHKREIPFDSNKWCSQWDSATTQHLHKHTQQTPHQARQSNAFG